MVDKSLILKSFDDVIDKCSKPKYFSKATRKVMDKFAKDTVDLDHEKALFIDNKGNIIHEMNGDTGSVHLDASKAWEYCESDYGGQYNDLNIEHNHPRIKGFDTFPPLLSKGDVNQLKRTVNAGYMYRSITAESNGHRVSLVRRDDVKYTPYGMQSKERTKYEKKLDKAYKKLDDAYRNYITDYASKIYDYTNIPPYDLQKQFAKKGGEYYDNDESRREITQKAMNDMPPISEYVKKSGAIEAYAELDIEILIE